MQQKKPISDIGTWLQCLTIFAGVISSQSPGRLPDLLGYLYQITWASQRYKWPAWVIFDQNSRQEMADQGSTELAHLDHTLYAQCFNGQTKDTCPLKPPPTKYPRLTPAEQAPTPTRPTPDNQVCRNYNRKDYKYGKKCHRIHQCLECGGPHPLAQCPMASSSSNKTEGSTHPIRQ